MSNSIDEALDRCLDRVAQGENIEACLADYPAYQQDLRRLIELAVSTRATASAVVPPAQSKARNFQTYMRAVQDAHGHSQRRGWSSFRWLRLARPILISLVAVTVLLAGAGMTTAASADSLPGEPLYWVKTAKESIQVRLPRSATGKAQAHADLANTRSEEIRRLVVMGRFTTADDVLKRMNRHLRSSAGYVGVDVTVNHMEMPRRHRPHGHRRGVDRLRSSLQRDALSLHDDIENILSGLTPLQKQNLRPLMRQPEFSYLLTIEAMDGESDSGHLPFIKTMAPRGSMNR